MSIREIPSGCMFWPAVSVDLSGDAVVEMYRDGFAGAWQDVAAQESMRQAVIAAGGLAYASEACAAYGLAETGAGKLSLTFPAMEKHFPACLPGPAQGRGDCVVHNSKNTALASLANEIEYGEPDEVTGKKEGVPDLSAIALAQGALSTEYLYWWRGHDGDGWDCATAAEMICKNGVLLRQMYEHLGVDFTKYSAKLAGRYGRSRPPENFAAEGRLHIVRTLTQCRSYEEIRDLVAIGCGISSCGSEGFIDQRDANGVSARSGSWAHAMSYLGVDDRIETKQLYGCGLVLVCNSWAEWNSGPRLIRGTQISIPKGCFWAKWTDISKRYAIAYSSVAGWPRKKLPDYGLSILG